MQATPLPPLGRKELRGVLDPLNAQLSMYPHISYASPSRVLLNFLTALREQLALYRDQHLGLHADLRTHGWKILTQRTTRTGAFAPSAGDSYVAQQMVGPYLIGELENPLTHSSKIFFITGVPPLNFKATGFGYVYDTTTGRIWGIDGDGKIFDEAAALSAIRD